MKITDEELNRLSPEQLANRLVVVQDTVAEQVKRNISEAIRIRSTGGHSLLSFGFQVHVYLLAHLLKIDEVESLETKMNFIGEAIEEIYQGSGATISPSELRKLVAIKLKDYLLRAATGFRVVFPLNAERTGLGNKRFFNVLDKRFNIKDWNYIYRHFTGVEKWEQYARDIIKAGNFQFENPTLLICETRARTGLEALNQVYQSYELLKASLNFPVVCNRYTRQFGGHTEPLALFGLADSVAVFHNHGELENCYGSDLLHPLSKVKSIKQDHLQASVRLLRDLTSDNAKSEVATLIIDAFCLYQRAIETADMEKSFLQMWQVLEMITCRGGDKNNSNDSVKKNAPILLRKSSTATDLLQVACDARNNLVHRGVFNDNGKFAVQALSIVVCNCLIAMITVRSKCSHGTTWTRFIP